MYCDGKYEVSVCRRYFQSLFVVQITHIDEFAYMDPVDCSISSHQGVRILFKCGSRIIFRLSGTAGSGATIRLYLERYEVDPSRINGIVSNELHDIATIALNISNIIEITGMASPTVIT